MCGYLPLALFPSRARARCVCVLDCSINAFDASRPYRIVRQCANQFRMHTNPGQTAGENARCEPLLSHASCGTNAHNTQVEITSIYSIPCAAHGHTHSAHTVWGHWRSTRIEEQFFQNIRCAQTHSPKLHRVSVVRPISI